MAKKASIARVDADIRRTLRRYGRDAVRYSKGLTPKKTGYTRSSWKYSITGIPEPSLSVYPKTQKAEKRLELALGPRRRKWIVSSGKKMAFVPETPNSAWLKKGGVVVVRRYMQRSRKGNKSIKRGQEKIVTKAMRSVIRILDRSGLDVKGSWEVQ